MTDPFFDSPILNSPYEYPSRHWELDESRHLLADSQAGQVKEAEISRTAPSEASTHNDIRQGFVYERVPHITLKAIANNAEIDVIYESRQPAVEAALADLNAALRGHSTAFEIASGGRKGANDPYKALKTSPKAEINRDAWDTLRSDISRPFPKPETGRIAVKVINHLGDEVIKVFRV